MNKKRLIVAWAIFLNLIFLCLNVSLAQPDLEVTGIFYEDKGQSYAIVDDKVVTVGDRIKEAEVLEINKDFVRFKYGDFVYEKKLSEKVSKTETNPVQEPIKKQSIKTTNDKEHYLKGKKLLYDYRMNEYEYSKRLELFQQALAELQLAIFETNGETREEVNRMIEECKRKIGIAEEQVKSSEKRRLELREKNRQESQKEKSSRELTDEMKSSGWKGMKSTQTKAISDSKKEIRNKRSESGSGGEWHGSWEGNPDFHKMTPEEAKEIERRNNEKPPPPVVCQGGSCRQATPNEIEEFEKLKSQSP